MTVLIVGSDAAGDDLESVVAAVAADHEVSRAETLEAVREALPACSAVVVGTLPSSSASAVRETVRSGVYCAPTTPVVRLASPETTAGGLDTDADLTADGFDGVVPADSPDELREVLSAIEQTDSYRDAVEDLYEACKANARGEPVDEAEMAAAFERADRAFAELPDVGGWTPYERVFVDTVRDDSEATEAEDREDETGADGEDEADDDSA